MNVKSKPNRSTTNSVDAKLLKTIDRTTLNKSYKMGVFLCFIKSGDLVQELSLDELAEFFRVLYRRDPFFRDLSGQNNEKLCDWSLSRIEQFIVRNPLTHLVDSSGGVFYLKDRRFGIVDKYYSELDPETRMGEVDTRVYKRLQKYFMTRYSYEGPF